MVVRIGETYQAWLRKSVREVEVVRITKAAIYYRFTEQGGETDPAVVYDATYRDFKEALEEASEDSLKEVDL